MGEGGGSGIHYSLKKIAHLFIHLIKNFGLFIKKGPLFTNHYTHPYRYMYIL